MRPLKRLTALALAAIAALSLVTAPASAAPPSPLLSYIHNSNDSHAGLGVIYNLNDGGALYDAVLPVNRRTDREFEWAQAEGFYVGPGFCANTWYQKNGQEFGRGVGLPEGQHITPRDPVTTDTDGVARWRVRTYRC